MKKIATLFILAVIYHSLHAQQVMVQGTATSFDKPLSGVMIDIFENGRFFKKMVTNKSGRYRFYLPHNQMYQLLFYYDGYEPQVFGVLNKSDESTQSIPINVTFDVSPASPDSLLAHTTVFSTLKPSVAAQFNKDIFEYVEEQKRKKKDSKAADYLINQAKDEENRFRNYKVTTSRKPNTNKDVTTTTIGNDTYLLEQAEAGTKSYFKNDKPITEYTYTFETTRRYEGVLKDVKVVKKTRKYKPSEHVK
jgi:hypothetical protein